MHQVVELPARHGSPAAYHADLLRNCQACDHYRDGVGVLEIKDAGRAIGERAREGLAGGNAAVGVEPLDCARYVCELNTVLAVGVELGPVGNDQTLTRADRGRRSEHGQRELARGRTEVADREVGAWKQRALARDRRDPIRLEDLHAEYLGCKGTHAASGADFGEPIKDRGVPCVAHAGILDVKTKLP